MQSTALILPPLHSTNVPVGSNNIIIIDPSHLLLQQQKPLPVPRPVLSDEVKERIESDCNLALSKRTHAKIASERKLLEIWRDKKHPGLKLGDFTAVHVMEYYDSLRTYIAKNKTVKQTARNTLATKQMICKVHFFAHVYAPQEKGSLEAEELQNLRKMERGMKKQAPKNKSKSPLLLEDLEKILKGLDRDTNMGLQDSALHFWAFFSAMRAGEDVALNYGDVREVIDHPGHIKARIAQSKGDVFKNGQTILVDDAIELAGLTLIGCLNAWTKRLIEIFGTLKSDDPLFRRINQQDQVVMDPKKTRMTYAYFYRRFKLNISLYTDKNPSTMSTHSNRIGWITNKVSKSAHPADMLLKAQRRARHKDQATTAHYVEKEKFNNIRSLSDDDEEKKEQ